METVVHVVTALLLVDQDHPMVLYRLVCLNDGAHGGQGRHIPLDVAPRVVHRWLDDWTVVLYVQDAEGHLIFLICVRTIGKRTVLCLTLSSFK